VDEAGGWDFELVVDDFVTLIVAGMETSANTMAFLFMELGRHPEMWERLDILYYYVSSVLGLFATRMDFVRNRNPS